MKTRAKDLGFCMTIRRLLLIAGTALLCAAPVYASDGVIEINQARALAGGVTTGDIAGFPVTLSESGSYRLTGPLSVTDENTTAVEITAGHITLDLNGFEIRGTNDCTGTPVTSCAQQTSGNGVHASSQDDIEIRNGIIRNMGGQGIQFNNGNLHRVIGVRVTECGQRGIYVSTNATVSGCSVYRNRFDGIFTGTAAHIEKNDIYGNGLNGIDSISTSYIAGNVIFANGDDGIETGLGNTILDNMIRSNTGIGINSQGGTSFYGRNVIDSNTGGTVVNGVQLGTNICNGNATCP